MKRARVVARSRVASAVLAVLLVTVAALGHRLSDLDTENQLVRAPLDTAVPYQSGTVVVSDVQVGTSLRQGTDRLTTRGLFVVLTVTLQASGRDSLLISDTRLLTRDGTTYSYALVVDQVIKADPGFATSGRYAFEVNPARIDDLTLELWNQGVTYRYYERTQTPLGITAANASQWVRAGAGRQVDVPLAEVVKALS